MAGVTGGLNPRRVLAQQDSRFVRVFAASSLTNSMLRIEAFSRTPGALVGGEMQVSHAATPALARQIEAGGPGAADIIISADPIWLDYLAERQLIVPATRRSLLHNDMVLAANPAIVDELPPVTEPLSPDLLPAGARLSMGDPALVPAGRYGQEALQAAGLWDDWSTRLAPSASASAAAALITRGEAPLGVVYRTDTSTIWGDMVVLAELPRPGLPPITYEIAMTPGGHDHPSPHTAYDFITSDDGLRFFTGRGFRLATGRD